MANVDYFLKIDGIEGESTDDKHKSEIDIESWSWGANQSGTSAGMGGGGAGKVNMQDFHFVMRHNKASPLLMKACATGQHIKEAKLTCRKAGGEQQEYMTIKFADLLVSSYQTGGNNGTDVITETIALNFAKVKFAYTVQNADGTKGDEKEWAWDVKANAPA